jgi:hypothetical protein
MKYNKVLLLLAVVFSATACYEDYDNDYIYSTVGFSSQKPLRTVVADTDMAIKVGVSFGGTRNVNTADWATYQLDASLLPTTPLFALLPSNYYTVSDASRMTVSNSNLNIADVTIKFEDAFYNDVNAYSNYFALPFKLTSSNKDIVTTVNGVKKDYSVVAIKAISKYHGAYYVKGSMVKIPAVTKADTIIYSNPDLYKNILKISKSLSRYVVQFPNYGNLTSSPADQLINLTVSSDGSSVGISAGGTTAITNASAILSYNKDNQPVFDLVYRFKSGTIEYEVKEQLIRRIDPDKEFRFVEW